MTATAMTTPGPSATTPELPRMLLVETQSPWQSGNSADFLQMAGVLADAGTPVHLHFIQNGVIWLSRDAGALESLRQRNLACLRISFDGVSLDLRGIPHAHAALHGQVGAMDTLVAEMADPQVKTIWHS